MYSFVSDDGSSRRYSITNVIIIGAKVNVVAGLFTEKIAHYGPTYPCTYIYIIVKFIPIEVSTDFRFIS
jgi:hypothetical protein